MLSANKSSFDVALADAQPLENDSPFGFRPPAFVAICLQPDSVTPAKHAKPSAMTLIGLQSTPQRKASTCNDLRQVRPQMQKQKTDA